MVVTKALMDQMTYTTEIDFFTISTLGDATKFGDLTENARGNGIAGFCIKNKRDWCWWICRDAGQKYH